MGGFGLALMYVPASVVVADYFDKKLAFASGEGLLESFQNILSFC